MPNFNNFALSKLVNNEKLINFFYIFNRFIFNAIDCTGTCR